MSSLLTYTPLDTNYGSDVLILSCKLPRNWRRWPALLRQLSSSLFFSVCFHACLFCVFVGSLSSSAAGRGIVFFFPFCIFFTSPTLNPLWYSFSALCAGKPRYLYPPSALVYAVTCLPSCSCNIKPHREKFSMRPRFTEKLLCD